MNPNAIKNKFVELFSDKPLLIRSPGRINLIGEHTDYNDGFVFPATIDKEVCFAVADEPAKENVKKKNALIATLYIKFW